MLAPTVNVRFPLTADGLLTTQSGQLPRFLSEAPAARRIISNTTKPTTLSPTCMATNLHSPFSHLIFEQALRPMSGAATIMIVQTTTATLAMPS